jgi:hypothetical protein
VQKITHLTGFLQYSDYIEREDRTALYPVFRSKKLQIGLVTKNKETIGYVRGVYEVAKLELIGQLLNCQRT